MAFGWLKKGIGTLGKVAKYAAPVLAMTGVGAPLAAGIGIAGSLADQVDNKKFSLGGALKGAALSGGSAYALGGNGGLGLGSKAGRFFTGASNVANAAGGGGGGWSTMDKIGLASAGLGALGGAYGSYAQGQAQDEDRALAQKQWEAEFGRQTGLDTQGQANWQSEFNRQTGLDTQNQANWERDFGESSRRYDQDFGESARRYDQDFGESARRYDQDFAEDTRRWDTSRADTRGDIEYERELMRSKGRAFSPMLGSYLRRSY